MGSVFPLRVWASLNPYITACLMLRYFLDLAWAQAGGLVGSAIQQELGVPGE
jgi:hypothetical protein